MLDDYQAKLGESAPKGGTKKAIKNFARKEKDRKKFKKSENIDKIKRLLQLGFTVKEITEDTDTSISAKHILQVRKELEQEDPEYKDKLEKRKQKLQEDVIYLYKEGKVNSRIYETIQYELSKKEIKTVIDNYERYSTWGER